MAKYIDKQKIAEQIDRARRACSEVECNPNEGLNDYYLGKAVAYKEMQHFLDNVEVREVIEIDSELLALRYRFLTSSHIKEIIRDIDACMYDDKKPEYANALAFFKNISSKFDDIMELRFALTKYGE